jgi:glyoxylase-like metal-dependent hydrolase (beta-lactamase superfamily II)
MKIEQIAVGFMQVFCYLVYDEETKEGILIDPAGNEQDLLDHLREEGIKLLYIVNTHGHADHTLGNDTIRNATGAKVVMHATDDVYYQRPESKMFARSMGFPTCGPADVRVQDGDELSFGKVTMKFIHTPGHSQGGCCILIEGNLFTGDTLFVGAVGRTDFPGGSFKQLIQSIKNLVKTLPPDTVVWPGHDYGDRPKSTLVREANTNPYITEYMD